jgi:hypothetical protein
MEEPLASTATAIGTSKDATARQEMHGFQVTFRQTAEPLEASIMTNARPFPVEGHALDGAVLLQAQIDDRLLSGVESRALTDCSGLIGAIADKPAL